MDRYKELFNLWDENAARDEATGADIRYQMEENIAENIPYYQSTLN